MLNRTIFSIVTISLAILSIATAAEAKPRQQKIERTSSALIASPALIECDMRGCSDRVVALRTVTPAAKAAAKPKYSQKQPRSRAQVADVTITCDMHGCSDRVVTAQVLSAQVLSAQVEAAPVAPAASPRQPRQQRAAVRVSHAEVVCDARGCSDRATPRNTGVTGVVDANGNSTSDAIVIGGRPAGCPRQFCGCEASRYVFGEIRPELNLAYNWVRKFPRTAPAPGMVAARSGHVMVLISHAGGNDWLVHDGNSGGGLTRQHVMSIGRYVIVDPRGSRTAER